MSVQSLPVPSNLRTEGMCYAQNRLSYLLWNGCPQIVSGSLYCLNQRAGRYHLQRQAVLHLYRRPPAVCHLVGREQLQGRVYGAYRDVLAPYLQHPRTRPQYCPCPPPSTSRLAGERKQTKRTPSGLRTSSSTTWFLAALSHHQIFVSSGIWCATAENSPISPRERKPGAELLDCLQYQAG